MICMGNDNMSLQSDPGIAIFHKIGRVEPGDKMKSLAEQALLTRGVVSDVVYRDDVEQGFLSIPQDVSPTLAREFCNTTFGPENYSRVPQNGGQTQC